MKNLLFVTKQINVHIDSDLKLLHLNWISMYCEQFHTRRMHGHSIWDGPGWETYVTQADEILACKCTSRPEPVCDVNSYLLKQSVSFLEYMSGIKNTRRFFQQMSKVLPSSSYKWISIRKSQGLIDPRLTLTVRKVHCPVCDRSSIAGLHH